MIMCDDRILRTRSVNTIFENGDDDRGCTIVDDGIGDSQRQDDRVEKKKQDKKNHRIRDLGPRHVSICSDGKPGLT